MNTQALMDTARAPVADDKSLLAMNESHPTSNKRFAKLGIPLTVETRRAYRELIVTTPGLGESTNGAILHDESKVFVNLSREALKQSPEYPEQQSRNRMRGDSAHETHQTHE